MILAPNGTPIPPTLSDRDAASIRTFAREMHANRRLTLNRGPVGGGTLYSELCNALGWEDGKGMAKPDEDQLFSHYEGGDIAQTVFECYPNASWKKWPKISERGRDKETDPSEFESAVAALDDRLGLWTTLHRLDVLSGVGRYGGVVLGFNDAANDATLKNEVPEGSELVWMRPFASAHLKIHGRVESPNDPRYGLPSMYRVESTDYHHSRVVHVAWKDMLGRGVGQSRLDAPWRMLCLLWVMLGSSAKLYQENAKVIRSLMLDPQFDWESAAGVAARKKIPKALEDAMNGGWMKLAGATPSQINGWFEEPEKTIECLKDMIAATSRIPKRKLFGNEAGELASTADEDNFNDGVDFQNRMHVVPNIVRPVLQRLIETGVLPTPEAGFDAAFEPAGETKLADKLANAKTVAEALKIWIESGGEMYMPWPIFAKRLCFSDEEIAAGEDAALRVLVDAEG